MKKILVVAIALIASSSSFAQISISQQKTIGVIRNGASEDASLSKSDQLVTLKYMGTTPERKWDTDFVKFKATDTELDQLYVALIQLLESTEKNSSLDITLGENNILFVEKTKVMGISYVSLGNGRTKTRPLNKNQISKLFGK